MIMVESSLLIDEFLFIKKAQGRSATTVRGYRKCLCWFNRDGGIFDQSSLLKLLCSYENSHTYNLYLTYLRSFYKWCIEEGYIERSPVRSLKNRRVPQQNRSLDEDELKELLAAMPKETFAQRRNYCLVLLMLDTGIRPGELLGLRTEDVNAKKCVVSVPPSVAKTREGRVLPVSLSVMKALSGYESTRPDTEFYFCNESGGPLAYSTLFKYFSRFEKNLGRKVTLYSFRHTFALLSLRHGADPFWLQTMLGHRDMSMTKRYISLSGKDLRDTQRRVSPVSRI